MKSLSGSPSRMFLLAFIFVLLGPFRNLQAQDVPQYTAEEYDAYQAITAESDAGKKTELIVNFFKSWPKSALAPNVTADFQAALNGLLEGKKWSQVITVGKQFLTVVPSDPYTVALVANAYAETKNYQQFVVFGEEIYKTNPNGNLAYSMAKAYQAMQNNAKFVEWAERTVDKLPDNYEMLLELAKIYGDSDRIAEAEKYSRQCLKVIQSVAKPAQISDADWTTYKNHALMACYYIIGNSAFKKQDYPTAISNLENSLKYNNRNDMAYYFLGQCYWQMNKSDMALRNFAKATVLAGPASGPAKQNLEKLYKQMNRGSLTGLDRILASAKAELGKK